MNEIERKELKGLGGWLVLFQIHIFNSLAGVLQMVVLVPVMRLITNSLMKTGAMSDLYGFSDGYPFNIFEFLYSPPAIAIISVLFVLTLLCIIFFYRKKIIFRTLFIIQSVVYLAGFGLYYFYTMVRMYTEFMVDLPQIGNTFMYISGAFAMIPQIGITVAIIIALFKSHRVKNTFS